MPGTPGHSGGSNALSLEEHKLRGTLQRSRVASYAAVTRPASGEVLSAAARRRALKGLPPLARRVATSILDAYLVDAAALTTLRSYALSCERLAALEASGLVNSALYKEIRANALLLRALDLER